MIDADPVQSRELTDASRWNLLYRKTQEVVGLRAFASFRQRGIEPILIKGLAAGLYYPETRSRVSVDIDIAVSKSDFTAASQIYTSEAAAGLAIDLHNELRHLDTLEWDDLFENSRLLDVDGGTIRVLRPEDHLRVLIVHWLTDGGGGKDRLWDVYYMIANRPPDFDWDRFLNSVSATRRRWLTCTIGLASRHLGLNLDDTPIKDEAADIPAWFIDAIAREWANDITLRPLHHCLNDPGMLLKQIRKRVPPNPIWATVNMEGSFDAKTRVFYQIGSVIKRSLPSFRRIFGILMQR